MAAAAPTKSPRGMPARLGVLKRQRADEFLISCNLDGFSLRLDFRVSARNRAGLAALAAEMDEIVLRAGSRLYFAKYSALRPRAFLGPHALQQHAPLKRQCDPGGLLQSNLSRRVLPELHPGGVG